MSTLRIALIDLLVILLTLADLSPKVKDSTINGSSSDLPQGDTEGGRESRMCSLIERSRFNRQMCLSYFGFRCLACATLLEEVYGEAGKSVVHVHHLTPLSEMGSRRVVNPITELVPLCPNCHNVAHRKVPPYTVQELIDLLGLPE